MLLREKEIHNASIDRRRLQDSILLFVLQANHLNGNTFCVVLISPCNAFLEGFSSPYGLGGPN